MKTNNETKFKRVGVFVEVVLASSYQDTAIELGNELIAQKKNALKKENDQEEMKGFIPRIFGMEQRDSPQMSQLVQYKSLLDNHALLVVEGELERKMEDY